MRHTLIFAMGLIGFGWFLVAGHETPPETGEAYRQSRLVSIQKQLQAFENTSIGKRRLGDWEMAKPISSIDNFLFKKMNEDGVPINAICDDATFIRRTNLILTGRLPEPARTRSFLTDTSPNKRNAYIDEVLASEAYQVYWAFWMQEYFQSTGFLLIGGLNAHNKFLADAVASNKPLDQMARDMLTGTGNNTEIGAANFKVRSVEGSRFPLDIYDNIAIRASNKFLGISIECVSCHDGAYHLEDINLFLTEKTREEFWGMAAYFAGTRFRVQRNDQGRPASVTVMSNPIAGYEAESDRGDRPIRQGGLFEPAYLFDGDKTIQQNDFLQTIAQKITSDRQFARHWANLLWAHVFGLGLVEPLDGFDPYRIDPNRALPEGWTHQALDLNLLEHITDLFISNQFQLKNYLRVLLNSSAYQMDSNFAPGKWKDQYAPYYTRYLARRLPAESIYDNLIVATGVAFPITNRSRDQAANTVQYAHELTDTTQPRGRAQEPIATFLNSFGRGNRYDTPRNNEGGITQALMLMNSPVIHERLSNHEGRASDYAAQGLPLKTLIQELFLDTLCRQPSQEEIESISNELAAFETDEERASSLMWLLINQVEFTFIY